MAKRVCPVWLGYLLLNPLRKLMENPNKMLGDFVSPGMTILEPGCAMGYFTLPLARMTGPKGRVVAVDIQEKMLAKLHNRAVQAGLDKIIEPRLSAAESLEIADLHGQVDLAAVIHVVHEVSDQGAFFKQLYDALKPEGRVIVIEPKGHVSQAEFADSLELASRVGFIADPGVQFEFKNASALIKA